MAKVTDTKVITNKVRLSFVNLLKPKAFEGQEPKYSCMLLIDKDDKETLDAIETAIDNAFKNDGGQKLKGQKRATVKTTLRDGDTEQDTEEYPEFANKMFMNVSSKQKPGILDAAKKPTDDPEDVYSGVYAYVSMNFFAYNNSGNKGISAGLNNLMIAEHGERLAGRASAESDFADFEVEVDEDFEDLI